MTYPTALLIAFCISFGAIFLGILLARIWDENAGAGIVKVLRHNVKPIALIICCTAIGGIFGAWLTGFLVGVAIVAFATFTAK